MDADRWPYMGILGRLIEVSFTAAENVTREDRYVLQETVEGRRRAQVRPSSPRSWSAEMPLSLPGELAVAEAFVTGAWGRGPWHWVSVQAQLGNLLTPREAVLVDRWRISSAVTDAGPVLGADGTWAPRSIAVSLPSGWAGVIRGMPVLPGRSFTWAMDVDGTDPQVQLAFYDAAGGTVSLHAGSGAGTGMQRVSVTATVPPGAVEARAGVRSSVTRAANPQATWTPGPVPYTSGHGCRSAVIDELSTSLVVIDGDGPVNKATFTIRELQ